MAFYICTCLPLREKRQRTDLAGLSAKKLFQTRYSFLSCNAKENKTNMPLERKKILMLQGFVVYEIFLLSGRKFFVQFFLFSVLILSAYTSFRCWFSALLFFKDGFFLSSAHTLFYRVFLEVKFCCPLLHCRLNFSSFFLGSGLSSVTGHTTFTYK